MTIAGSSFLSYLHENLRRTFAAYETASGVFGLLILCVVWFGYGRLTDDPAVQKFAVTGALLLVLVFVAFVTPWIMWSDAQREIRGLKERLAPRLRLVFVPNKIPYDQTLRALQPDGQVRDFRHLRVGVINDSDAVIADVRVVLHSFERLPVPHVHHSGNDTVLLEHALNVMGLDDKHGRVSVTPSLHGRPTAFVDCIVQEALAGQPFTPYFAVRYASPVTAEISSLAQFRIGLRVEGGGTSYTGYYTFGASLPDTKLSFTPETN